mgnify:CR=1 FL=1
MEWKEAFGPEKVPLPHEIADYVETPLWNELCTAVEGRWGVTPRYDYSQCSMAPGWNVKYKKGGKALCTLYPHEGGFTCMVSVGPSLMPQAELLLPGLSPETAEIYRNTAESKLGKWLWMEMTSPAIIHDALRLMELRMAK